MKYYVVLDTNVVVSALLNLSSIPGLILQEALAGRVFLCCMRIFWTNTTMFCTAPNLSLTVGH